MVLSEQTKIGLTFGQVMTALGFSAALIFQWVNINSRVATLEAQYQEMRIFREENRQDHQTLSIKIDEIYKLEMMRIKNENDNK